MKILIDIEDTLRPFTVTMNYQFNKIYKGRNKLLPDEVIPLVDSPLPEDIEEFLKQELDNLVDQIYISKDGSHSLSNHYESEEFALAFRGNLTRDGSYFRDPKNDVNVAAMREPLSIHNVPVDDLINMSLYYNSEKILDLLQDFKEVATSSVLLVRDALKSPSIERIYLFYTPWSDFTNEEFEQYFRDRSSEKIILVNDFFHMAQIRESLLREDN